MKQEYFDALVDHVGEFIAFNDIMNSHYLFDEDIVGYFKQLQYKENKFYKKKHILKAINQVR